MSFNDLTGRHVIAVIGNPTVVDDQSPWGGGSTYFDGSFSYLRADEHPEDWAFGAGDFCIEFAAKVAAGSFSNFGFITLSGRAFQGYDIGTPSGYVGGWWNSSSEFLPQVWQSIAIDRKNGQVRLFIEGQLVSENAFPYELADASPLLIGIIGQGDSYYRFKGHMGWVRITRASRHEGSYTPQALAAGPADPLWSSTVLLLSLGAAAPAQRTTIDSMTADTAPGGDWTTYDGSAGRVVSGSISAALADGQSVTVSFDGGATWATATTSGLSWSITDPGEHATSWIIVARVSAGSQSGPVTVRSVALIPPPAEIENPYPPLVTSEHAVRPRFMATVEALTRPLVRAQSLIAAMPAAFDLDVAEGVQLDAVGRWVGRSRYLSIPISGAWFSFDTSGLGFDEGTWKGPFDATTGISRLDDGPYRLLLKARIAANQWDGTRQGAVDAWSVMFDGTGVTFQIQDNADMSMDVLVYTDHPLDAVTTALITGGYLGIKPSGVTINSYTITEV